MHVFEMEISDYREAKVKRAISKASVLLYYEWG
jgi:hypothetical protein